MTLTAVLFTGGLSSRMGVDKATLQIDGEPFWTRQLRILQELQPDALWISARSRPIWCPPEIGVVLDEPPSRGPLSGLTAGLRRLQTSHLLVLAIDLPRMTAEHLHKLRGLAWPGAGVIPLHDGSFEPLCAIYPAEAADAAIASLGGEDVSLWSLAKNLLWQKRAFPLQLSDSDKRLYHNVNSPADLLGNVAATAGKARGRGSVRNRRGGKPAISSDFTQ